MDESSEGCINRITSQLGPEAATVNFASPRPTPQFYHDKETFSTKKAKFANQNGTPHECAPPRPPVKSAPPVSRIFARRPLTGARAVSFREEESMLSPHYNSKSKVPYFEQVFDILGKIGEGSFGEVYKVRSKEDGQLYAVKKSREKFRGESDRKRKLQEVDKFEKLPPHDNLVHFYGAWEEQMVLFMQIELCTMSLAYFTQVNHDVPEQVIWGFLVDLLMGVKHLHDHSLVHMDIKPENIFISDHVCKLGDFGLVLDLSKDVTSEAVEGDPKYLAPEILMGKVGRHVDIFSLGITMLELASDLDIPKGGEGWHILRQGELPLKFLEARSPKLKYIIGKMLVPDYSTRPTVDQLLAMSSLKKYTKKRLHEYVLRSMMASTPPPQNKLAPYHSEYDSSDLNSSLGAIVGIDSSTSDDDSHSDVSLSNNSVGVPLEQSSPDSDSILMPPPTPRRAFTAPLLRHRPYAISPFSSSPVSTRKKRSVDCESTSPVKEDSSFESERSLTPPPVPRTLFPMDVDEEKTGIEPKNLMQMFDAASDED
ncbi:membrane-associated tyrosine- and threonine-specific cdc2-inhibitory kinase-like isoform X2 [Pomacea canaliculata]|uniref:membrane-associated tyrosine- and threonine-specific cdc2-inhibitory kinase-like isoform X2 n=1 Tax=Pomacea canaliculata TaxID=400727 RepID=UPI000D727103|nr:membrane-associated tyrosine- and threonine-specific cdc2-inhibitory kinase-like isoform X2 [Pomacea canaliculata]